MVAAVGGEDALHRHLLDMGITPGVTVLLQKTAPMGDPVEIRLRGYALTLRLTTPEKSPSGERRKSPPAAVFSDGLRRFPLALLLRAPGREAA